MFRWSSELLSLRTWQCRSISRDSRIITVVVMAFSAPWPRFAIPDRWCEKPDSKLFESKRFKWNFEMKLNLARYDALNEVPYERPDVVRPSGRNSEAPGQSKTEHQFQIWTCASTSSLASPAHFNSGAILSQSFPPSLATAAPSSLTLLTAVSPKIQRQPVLCF